MKHSNLKHSFIVLFYLLFWTGFSFLFCMVLEQNFQQISHYNIKVLSLNINTLKLLKSELLELDISRQDAIPSKLQKFAYLSKELTYIADRETDPLFGQLSISSNVKLTQNLLTKYNLKENYLLNESLGKMPNILNIQINGQSLDRETFAAQLQLFQNYQTSTLLKGPILEIKQKLEERELLDKIYWIANLCLALFLILLLYSMRKSTIWCNHHRWTIYKKLGINTSHRKVRLFLSSLLYFCLPIIFGIIFCVFINKYNLLFKVKLSYSSIVKLFIHLPLFELTAILFSSLLIHLRFRKLAQ